MTDFLELPIYHKPLNSSIWNLIGTYVLSDLDISIPESSDLGKFNFKYTNLIDNDLFLALGDEICICENINRMKVWGDIAAGKITHIESGECKGWINDVPIFEFNIEVTQKDFSVLPLTDFSYSTEISLNDVLDTILLKSNPLGGIWYTQTISKYYIECDTTTFNSATGYGTDKEVLTDILKSIGLNWYIKYLVQPDNTYTLKLIQQVIISE